MLKEVSSALVQKDLHPVPIKCVKIWTSVENVFTNALFVVIILMGRTNVLVQMAMF